MVFSVFSEPFTDLEMKKMNNNNRLLLFLFAFLIISCSKKDSTKKTEDYNRGQLTILTDDSFKSVTQAIGDAYMINYPETKIDVKVMKEDLAFMDLLKNKSKLIVMSRDLSEKEKAEYERVVDLKFQPANFAADAVVFVVPKNSTRTNITLQEIEAELNSENKNLIFDGTNSGNLNFVAQKLNKKPSELKFSTISGNANVIREIAKYPNKIGVISLNTISRPYGEQAKQLRDMIKILPVTDKNISYEPNAENVRKMVYPFTRVLYLLTNEGNFGMANGVIRFACTQLGQIVVEKEGLQPYNIFKREVQMN